MEPFNKNTKHCEWANLKISRSFRFIYENNFFLLHCDGKDAGSNKNLKLLFKTQLTAPSPVPGANYRIVLLLFSHHLWNHIHTTFSRQESCADIPPIFLRKSYRGGM